ncbi:hypothetical protein H7J86_26175 [Mycobacterium hackensackense]|uniref:hypothetical protein n=1 Tax=Mycobacterium hackensackense TaxID=228909 RepID=UPI002265887D|nr:hypothetical protein [Mycobacterium hackensackense]MCV7255656.1 hypothetical protein [Mycobacterium hackensackense]
MTLESKPPETDPLAQLDAELDDSRICECPCDEFKQPHRKGPCTRPATHYVEAHCFGWCQHPKMKANPDITADGDRCSYLCTECYEDGIALAQVQIAKLPARAVCPPPPAGFGCGRPIATLDDYVPVRRPL